MQSTSVFLNIAKFANFRSKNADVSRTQAVCFVIHIFCGSYNCAKFHHCSICVTDVREGWRFCPTALPPPTHTHTHKLTRTHTPVSSPEKAVNYCCKTLHLRCLRGSWPLLILKEKRALMIESWSAFKTYAKVLCNQLPRVFDKLLLLEL